MESTMSPEIEDVLSILKAEFDNDLAICHRKDLATHPAFEFEDEESWEPGDYIIVADHPDKPCLDGSYSIDYQINNGPTKELTMIWNPYPEKPQIGIKEIIDCLMAQVPPRI